MFRFAVVAAPVLNATALTAASALASLAILADLRI
jgi:hypothetical protein